MALTDQEIDSLRFHLGYGNIDDGGAPYTPDTFLAVFEGVVSPNLSVGSETSATTTIAKDSIAVVTPAAMTGITANAQLVIDVAEDAEVVTVKAVTATTFTARFKKAHASSGYPIATLRGVGRLRLTLAQADAAWAALTDSTLADEAGLQSVDKNDVVWFGNGSGSGGFQVLKHRMEHYRTIVVNLSRLVRVDHIWHFGPRRTTRLEAY